MRKLGSRSNSSVNRDGVHITQIRVDCLGDERCFQFVPRDDRVAQKITANLPVIGLRKSAVTFQHGVILRTVHSRQAHTVRN